MRSDHNAIERERVIEIDLPVRLGEPLIGEESQMIQTAAGQLLDLVEMDSSGITWCYGVKDGVATFVSCSQHAAVLRDDLIIGETHLAIISEYATGKQVVNEIGFMHSLEIGDGWYAGFVEPPAPESRVDVVFSRLTHK